jgi:hypothetical protein
VQQLREGGRAQPGYVSGGANAAGLVLHQQSTFFDAGPAERLLDRSHVTRHTPHVTRHTAHVTRHTPHVTRHTSHVTRRT